MIKEAQIILLSPAAPQLLVTRQKQQEPQTSADATASFPSLPPTQTTTTTTTTMSDQLIHMVQEFEKLVRQNAPDAYDAALFQRLQQTLPEAQEFAPTLDFESIECNGIRMLVRHAESYMRIALTKRKAHEIRDFLTVLRMTDVWCNLLIKFKTLPTTDSTDNPDEAKSFYQAIFSNYDPDAMSVILGPQYHIIQTPGLKLPYAMIERAIIFTIAKKFTDQMKALTLSRKTVASTLAKLAPTATVADVANVVRKMNVAPVRATYAITRYITAFDKPVNTKKYKISVPTPFKITLQDNDVRIMEQQQADHQNNNAVKFYLLQYGQSKEFTNKLAFYIHGGAFVGPKAGPLNNFYLKDVANNVKGLKILSMDYSVAPEARFPVALQQILDTYLWCTSGRQEVLQTLGFYPDEIIIMGDSSGGNLSASLLVALNEIRNMGGKPFMPRSALLCFPKTSLQFDLFPSLCLSVFDPIISIQLMCAACCAYVPFLMRDDNGNWNLLEDNSDVPMDFLMRDEYKVLQSPLLSPVRYAKLDQLSDVNLLVMAVANDPLLDESIEMARQWRGRVKLHVIEGVTHGAFIFNYFSRVGTKCVPILADMMRQAFFDS